MNATDPRSTKGATQVPLNKAKSSDRARQPMKRLSMSRKGTLDMARRASLRQDRGSSVSNVNKSLILDPIDFGRMLSNTPKAPRKYISNVDKKRAELIKLKS